MEGYFPEYKIAEMAMAVEEKSIFFYSRLAEIVSQETTRNFFLELARWELKHKETLRVIAEAARNKEPLRVVDGASYAYVKETIATMVKRASDLISSRTLVDMGSEEKCIDIALQYEHLVVETYTNIDDSLHNPFGEVLSQIIEEEKQHIRLLQEEKAKNRAKPAVAKRNTL